MPLMIYCTAAALTAFSDSISSIQECFNSFISSESVVTISNDQAWSIDDYAKDGGPEAV